jgi:DNA repair ATPase RecN
MLQVEQVEQWERGMTIEEKRQMLIDRRATLERDLIRVRQRLSEMSKNDEGYDALQNSLNRIALVIACCEEALRAVRPQLRLAPGDLPG